MRLERGAEASLALELGAGGLELVTGILEFAGEDALLADRLASFIRPGRLGREQAQQDEVVLEEERAGIRVDDQPALHPQVRFDRDRDGPLPRPLAHLRDRSARRRSPRSVVSTGGSPLTMRTTGGSPSATTAAGPLVIIRADRASAIQIESGSPSTGAASRRLPEVEGDGALLQASQLERRQEGREISDTGRQGHRPGDEGHGDVRRPTGRRGCRTRTGDQDPPGEQECGDRRDAQPCPRVPDARPARAQEEGRGDRLDRHEIADDDRGHQDVAADADREADDGDGEPDQARRSPRSARRARNAARDGGSGMAAGGGRPQTAC